MTIDPIGRPSTPSLVADALSQMTTLFETEIRLVRTEVSEKISAALRAVVVMLVAAVLLLAALVLLLIGVVNLLIALGIAPYLAYFIVGVVIAVGGGIAIYLALGTFSNLTPQRTLSQLGKDADIVKDQVR